MSVTPAPTATQTPAQTQQAPSTSPAQGTARTLYFALAVCAGALTAFSGRINGSLSSAMGNPLVGGAIASSSPLFFISIAMAWSRPSRQALRRIYASMRRGHLARLDARGSRSQPRPVRHNRKERARPETTQPEPRGQTAQGKAAHRQPAPASRLRPSELRLPRLAWWQFFGGIAGSALVLSQTLAIPVLGVSVFVVAQIAGQSIGSLLVDHFGLTPGGKRPITLPRLIGPALAISAAALSFSGGVDSWTILWIALVPLVAGAGMTWHQATTGHVRAAAIAKVSGSHDARAGTTATNFQNFLVGSTLVWIVLALVVALTSMPQVTWPRNPVLYLAGLFAITIMSIIANVVHRIGVLMLSLSMIAGKTCGALLIDTVTGYTPSLTTLLAALLTLAALAVPLVASRRARG